MAAVYILYSPCLSKFYTGSCRDVFERIDQHLSDFFAGAFTATAKDWIIYFHIDGLTYKQARSVEVHIKRMKSKKFIEDLKKYPELVEKLILLYK
jgi:putative endonuclease